MPTLRWLTRDEDVRAAEGVPYRLLDEDANLVYNCEWVLLLILGGRW